MFVADRRVFSDVQSSLSLFKMNMKHVVGAGITLFRKRLGKHHSRLFVDRRGCIGWEVNFVL
jgi:hypothetical protein